MIKSIADYMFGIFKADSREIGNLNGIRAIAIFFLFAGHMYRMLQGHIAEPNEYWRNFLDNTSFILDIFFTLSGFLISGALFRQLDKKGNIDFKNFFIKRTLRIFPPYYFFLALQFFVFIPMLMKLDPANADKIAELKSRIIFDILYVSNYITGTMFHGWSLSMEEQFYISFPLFLIFIFRYIPKKYQLISLILLYVAPVFYRAWYFYGVIVPADPSDATNLYNKGIYYPFHGHVDSILAGVIFGYISVHYKHWLTFITENTSIRLSLHTGAWVVIISYCFLVHEFAVSPLSMVIRFNVFSIGWGIVMLMTMHHSSWLNKFLSLPFFGPVAKLSYCAYILHMVVLAPYAQWYFKDNPVTYLNIFLATPFLGLLIFIFAYIFHLIAERPFQVWKEKVAGKTNVERPVN